MTTHAVFETVDQVRAALATLAEGGVAASSIEVRSSIPLPHDVHPVGDHVHSRVPLAAMVGGLLGGTAAFSLATLSAMAYPLPTGGMPIVSLPATGIITFEGLAIGAILCTVGTVFVECGLPTIRAKPGPLDAHLARGGIVVSVEGESPTWTEGATEVAESD